MRSHIVDVCGTQWTVKWKRRRWEKHVDGTCIHPPAREIWIKVTGQSSYDLDTLVHEVLHAAAKEQNHRLSEARVQAYAQAIVDALLHTGVWKPYRKERP